MNKVPVRAFCKCHSFGLGVWFRYALAPVKIDSRFSISTVATNTFTSKRCDEVHPRLLDRNKVNKLIACFNKSGASQLKYSTDNKGQGNQNDEADARQNNIEQDLIKNDPDLKSLLADLRNDFDGGPTTKELKRTATESLKHRAEKGNSENKKQEHPLNLQQNSIIKSEDVSLNLKSATQSYSLDSLRTNFSETDSVKISQDQGSGFQYDYSVAQDIEEYDYKDEKEIAQQQIRPEKVYAISLNRGNSGVFDVDELLVLLEDLGAENVVSIPVPPEARFCDHMVIASAKSKRHLTAINDEMLWVHKRKKSPSDPHLNIEGLGKSDWSAMDMGNIVLHVFYGDKRQYYDIESLWTLGPQHDPKCQEENQTPYNLSPEELFWLETGKSNAVVNKTVAPSGSEDVSKAVSTTSEGGDLELDAPKTPCFS